VPPIVCSGLGGSEETSYGVCMGIHIKYGLLTNCAILYVFLHCFVTKAQIPVIHKQKRRKYRGRRSGCLEIICWRVCNLPLPSVLLANVQSLENKLEELCSRLSYQRDIKYCNILCFTEPWLNDNTIYSWLGFPCIGRTEQLCPVR
jgi:hypothetical protein